MATTTYTVHSDGAIEITSEKTSILFDVTFTSSTAVSSPRQRYSVAIAPGDDKPAIRVKVEEALRRATIEWDRRVRKVAPTFTLAADLVGSVTVPDDLVS